MGFITGRSLHVVYGYQNPSSFFSRILTSSPYVFVEFEDHTRVALRRHEAQYVFVDDL
jgi:Fe2+ transport system protein FeoA